MQSAFCCKKQFILKATTSSYAANKSIAFNLAEVADDLMAYRMKFKKCQSVYSLTGMTSPDGLVFIPVLRHLPCRASIWLFLHRHRHLMHFHK